jgi:hypothetical protein
MLLFHLGMSALLTGSFVLKGLRCANNNIQSICDYCQHKLYSFVYDHLKQRQLPGETAKHLDLLAFNEIE